MSEIYVHSSEALSDVVQELATLNQEYMSKVEGLDREQANLVQAWEGEASDAFQERYRRERDYFCAFATVVTDYINGLSRILATYEQAEASNVAIAGDGVGILADWSGLLESMNHLYQNTIQSFYGSPTINTINGLEDIQINVGAAIHAAQLGEAGIGAAIHAAQEAMPGVGIAAEAAQQAVPGVGIAAQAAQEAVAGAAFGEGAGGGGFR